MRHVGLPTYSYIGVRAWQVGVARKVHIVSVPLLHAHIEISPAGRALLKQQASRKERAMAGMRLPELALRLCVIPLAVASLWEMATNKQADDTYGEVTFSDLSGFT